MRTTKPVRTKTSKTLRLKLLPHMLWSERFVSVLRLRALLATLALPLVLAAAPTSSPPPVTLKVGEVGPPLALLAAIDRGYFAKQNITVDLIPLVNGPALISATIGGSLDLNFGDTFAWAAAVGQGFKVQLFQSSNTANEPARRCWSIRLAGSEARPISKANKSASPAPRFRC